MVLYTLPYEICMQYNYMHNMCGIIRGRVGEFTCVEMYVYRGIYRGKVRTLLSNVLIELVCW